jgi:uncharacterized membrane protein
MTSNSPLDIKRIQSLTDSIFAVAMTILVLDIKLPLGLKKDELNNYFFKETLTELLIYIASFITLGIFWIGSHFHHHHINNTDRNSSWINIIFLMLICMVPFSTSVLKNYRQETISILFYALNLILINMLNLIMLWYAWKMKYLKPHFNKASFRNSIQRLLIPIFIYIGAILISFISVKYAIGIIFLPILLHVIPERVNTLMQNGSDAIEQL